MRPFAVDEARHLHPGKVPEARALRGDAQVARQGDRHAGPGGGADVYTRLFARHYGRHLPGSPSVVAKNVLGAGGLKLGALGGPQTFSAQFAEVMRQRFPAFAELVLWLLP